MKYLSNITTPLGNITPPLFPATKQHADYLAQRHANYLGKVTPPIHTAREGSDICTTIARAKNGICPPTREITEILFYSTSTGPPRARRRLHYPGI